MSTAAKNREIYCVDLTFDQRAKDLVLTLREQGRNPKVYQRTIRAEGIDVVGFVVVVDSKAAGR